MKEKVYVTIDGRLVVIWYFPKKRRSLESAFCIEKGLLLGGAECLGDL